MRPDLQPEVVARHFRWEAWEALIRRRGITIDRPYGTAHPVFPQILYPIDYGFVNGTTSTDGAEVDVFRGSAVSGLVGLAMTCDLRRGDREIKLLYDCSPEEIYLAHGFLNFDRRLMTSTLALRRPMHALWQRARNLSA